MVASEGIIKDESGQKQTRFLTNTKHSKLERLEFKPLQFHFL